MDDLDWLKFLNKIAENKKLTTIQKETLKAKFPTFDGIVNDRDLLVKLSLAVPVTLTKRLGSLYKKFGLPKDLDDKAIALQIYLQQESILSESTVEPNPTTSTRSIVIGISGGSCSGKTWLSRQFQQLCPLSVCLFDLDGYYKNLNDVMSLEHTHDNPDSINFDDALFDLAQLKAGRAVDIPTYNFESHQRDGSRLCQPASIIIVEGVFSFSKPRFLQEFDFKVWVEAHDVTRYQRRLDRDVRERGRDTLEVSERYEQNVKPGYDKFIYPNRRVADITIHNDINSNFIPEGLYALLAYCIIDKSIFKK